MKFRDWCKEQNNDHDHIDKSNDTWTTLLGELLVEEKIIQDPRILNENKTSSFIQMIVLGMLVKINNVSNKAKQETDINKKMDLLVDLVKLSSYGSLASAGVSSNNTKILSRVKRIKI